MPVFGLVVSDAKVERLANAVKDCGLTTPFKIVSMNSLEAKKVLKDPENLRESLAQFGTEFLCISEGEGGMKFFSSGENEIRSYDAYDIDEAFIASEIGAGDALFSSLVDSHLSREGSVDCDSMYNIARDDVLEVLMSTRATRDRNIFSRQSRLLKPATKMSLIVLIGLMASLYCLISLTKLSGEIKINSILPQLLGVVCFAGLSGSSLSQLLSFVKNNEEEIPAEAHYFLINSVFGIVAGVLVLIAYTMPYIVDEGLLLNFEKATGLVFSFMVFALGFAGGFASESIITRINSSMLNKLDLS